MDFTNLDPQVVTLAKAIRHVESNGDFNAVGDGGDSHGAYQFNKGNFAHWATQFGLDPNDFSPVNQDKVAYAKMKAWKDQGYHAGEIAAMWNGSHLENGRPMANNPQYITKVQQALGQSSGQSNGQLNPNQQNTQTPQGPGYLPMVPVPAVNTNYPVPQTQSVGQQAGNIGAKVVNGTADVLGVKKAGQGIATAINTATGFGDTAGNLAGQDLTDSKKLQTALYQVNQKLKEPGLTLPQIQQLKQQKDSLANELRKQAGMPTVTQGDIDEGTKLSNKEVLGSFGNVALDVLSAGSLPGEGAASGVLSKGKPIAETLAKGTGLTGKALKAATYGTKVGEGLLTGYGFDVAGKANNNQDNILKPGLGTAVGGLLPGVLGLKGLKGSTEEAVVNKVQQAYEDALGATKSGVQKSSKVLARSGESPAEFLAHAGLPPETAEVNGRRIFTTGPESQTYKAIEQRANDLTALRDEALSKTDAPSSIEGLREQALEKAKQDFIGKNYQTAVDHINSEFDAFKGQSQVNQDNLDSVNEIKKYFQGNAKYDATRPSTITEANRMVANLAKTQVENDAEKAGMPGIKKLNKIIQQHLDFLDTGDKKGILSKLNGQVIKGGRLGTYVKQGIGASIGAGAGKMLGGGILGEIGGAVAGAKAGDLASRLTQLFAVGGPRISAVMGKMATENPEVVDMVLKNLGREGEQVAPNVIPRTINKTSQMGGLLGKLMSGVASRH